MATLLVTGAAGFIGSHTCDLLLAEGNQVVGVDNFRTGRRGNLSIASRQRGFQLIEADVSEPASLADVVAQSRPAAIIHLAALVSVPESIAQPELNFRLNLQATHVVAEAARRHGVPRVVFASSAAVYGEPSELPLTEASWTHPISPYGGAKLASEALLLSYAKAFGITVRCHRYFNVFGPRQDPNSPYSGVISIFADTMRARSAATIFGDGQQTRDFISVHDVARANAIAATAPNVKTGVANICTGKPTSLNELAAIMRDLLSGAPAPVHAEARVGDIRHSVGSPAGAQAELGFTAEVSLEEGLQELLTHQD